MQALPAQPSRSQSDSGQPGGPRRAAGERAARSLGPRRLSPKPCRGPPEPSGPPSEHAPSRDLSDSDIGGALEDIAREAIVLPMASKSTQPTLEVADSESDDNASWSVCSPRSPKATSSSRPALPRQSGKIGKVPPPALPKPAPAVRPRARSLAGPHSLFLLASASRVPSRPLRTFSLPQPSLALNQHFAALRQGQPLRQLTGHISCSLHRRKQPSALEDSAAYQHGQVCCKPWVPQASSGHKFSKREAYLSLCLRFLDFCVCAGLQVGTLTLAALADYLQACAESRKQDRSSCKLAPKQALKALSWLARIAELPCLKDLLGRPLIAAFRQIQSSRTGKKPWFFPWQPFVPGSALCRTRPVLRSWHCCWEASSWQPTQALDFSLDSLSLTASALRGICWATKTSSSGQPFAVTLTGITGRDIASSWVLHWLRQMQASWKATESEWHDLWANVQLPRLSQPQRRQPSLCTALRSAFYQPRHNSAFQMKPVADRGITNNKVWTSMAATIQ